jgi:tetratricopeptide (TPR) repeat protein
LSVFLFFIGCGGKDDLADRFRAEELLSKADRLKEQLVIKGSGYSNDDFRRLKEAYEMVINAVDLPKNQAEVESASPEIKQAWAVALLASTRIASLYLDRREYDSAFVYYQNVANNPAVDDLQRNVIHRHMAYVREKSGDFEEAAALYDSVSYGYIKSLNPARPEMEAISAPIKKAEMYRNIGDTQRFIEELEKARDYYGKIIDEYPGSNLAEISLGKIAASYLMQGRYREALNILESAGKDEEGIPKPGTLLLISDIYLNNIKDYANAERFYREFLRFYPDHVDKAKALLGLGLSLYENKEYEMARDAVAEVEKTPGVSEQIVAQSYYLIALCYEKEDNWQLAEGQLELIKAMFPGNSVAFDAALYIVAHYRSKGKRSNTEREFEEAVDYINRYVESTSLKAPAAAQAGGYLARAYIENGEIEKAIEQLEKLYYKYPNTPDGSMAPLKIADLYENSLHDRPKAAEWLDTFIKENPGGANIDELKSHVESLKSEDI